MIQQAAPLDEAVEAALDGTILQATSISGVLKVAHHLRRGSMGCPLPADHRQVS